MTDVSGPVEPAPQATARRDQSLDQAKGLLIALVVIGHLVSGTVVLPASSAWYIAMRDAIYLFHMPAFFFVSGIIFTFSAGKTDTAVTGQIARRADRLLVPYTLMGIFISLGKYGAQFFMHVDNFVPKANFSQTFFDGISGLFVTTSHSASGSIWFLLAYFVCLSIAIPLARSRHGARWMLVLTAILFLTPRIPFFYLDKLSDNAVFFAMGWLYRADARRPEWLKRRLPGWAIATGLFLLIFPALHFHSAALLWRLLFGAGAALLILWAMEKVASPLLAGLGAASMIIYVLNTPIIGVVRAIFLKLHMFDTAFSLFLVIATIAAIAIPVLVKRRVVLRSAILSRYLG
jgi:fucose 4-O-acetylase-like acetyltransferase